MSDAPEAGPVAEPRPSVQVGELQGCGSCRFLSAIAGTQGGVCRRLPPVPLMLGSTTLDSGQAVPIVATYWPEVAATMWCGEWSPRLGGAVDFSALAVTEGSA